MNENEEKHTEPPLQNKLVEAVRSHLLLSLLVVFVLGAVVSTFLADTQNKVEAAYSSGLEEGQSVAEASYNSLLEEQEMDFSSQLEQQEEDFESAVAAEYESGRSAGFEEGREQGYAQGQSEAQEKISQLESTIETYRQEQESSQSQGSTGYGSPSAQTSNDSVTGWDTSSEYVPEPEGGIVYWTPNGKSYHSTQNCTTLKRSKTIRSGTVSEAIASGHGDPCNVCN